MNTLVTGGTGLVGFNIIKELLLNKRKVRALVRSLEKGKKLLPPEVELVQGDITDIASIRNAMKGCDVVYHAAGFPEQWMKDNSIFYKVNVEGSQNMVDVALELGVSKFIYTSTIDVFFARKGEEYNEAILDNDEKGTYYERSKQEADRRVVKAMENGLVTVFLHPSGVYGPGPTDSPGTNDFILKLKNKNVPVLLPGGYPIVFSEDVAKGHYLAEQKGKNGSRYILSDQYLNLKDMATMMLTELKMKPNPPKVMPYFVVRFASSILEFISNFTNKPPLIPRGQLHFLQWQAIPKSQLAQKELAWQITPLKEGLSRTIDFLRL